MTSKALRPVFAVFAVLALASSCAGSAGVSPAAAAPDERGALSEIRDAMTAVATALSGTAAARNDRDGELPLDKAIEEAAADMESRLEEGARAALLNFGSASPAFSEYILEELAARLVNGRKVTVVERSELDLIRQEEAFQLSGEVSDESAQSIGRKLGAQVIVSGSLSGVGQSYRFRVKTLAVETAAVAAAYTADINPTEEKVVSLLAGAKPEEEAAALASAEIPVPEGLLYEIAEGKTVTITKYIGSAAEIDIPKAIEGLPVTIVGEGAFRDCKTLERVGIPDSVTSIGWDAFLRCTGLTSVDIPSRVTSIGRWAFNGCSSLTSITIPSSLTSIRQSTFSRCSSLTSIDIPSSVTSIDSTAFNDCNSLITITVEAGNREYISVGGVLFNKSGKTLVRYPGGKSGSYTIPSSVTSIGSGAFSDCSNLTSVSIPSSVTSISDYAFSGCSSLTSIYIPSSVTSIGNRTLIGCDSLTNIYVEASNRVYSSIDGVLFNKSGNTLVLYPVGKKGGYAIPSSVTSIGVNAFFYCIGLTSVSIPSSVISIGNDAFARCSSLSNISIPSSVTSIGNGVFWGCSSLTSISLPSSVTSIGGNTFSYCNGLTSINIPSSVTSIGYWAFSFCSGLTSIAIPSSIETIGERAFYYCQNLKSATLSRRTKIEAEAFPEHTELLYRD